MDRVLRAHKLTRCKPEVRHEEVVMGREQAHEQILVVLLNRVTAHLQRAQDREHTDLGFDAGILLFKPSCVNSVKKYACVLSTIVRTSSAHSSTHSAAGTVVPGR